MPAGVSQVRGKWPHSFTDMRVQWRVATEADYLTVQTMQTNKGSLRSDRKSE